MAELVCRYAITSGPRFDPTQAARFGREARCPLEIAELKASDKLPASRGTLPAAQAGFATLTPESLVVTAFKAAEDGQGLIVRVYETAGRETEGVLKLPFMAITSAREANAVELPGKSLQHDARGVHFHIQPYQVLTLRLKGRAGGVYYTPKHLEFLITCSKSESKLLQKVQNQPSSYGQIISVKRGIETFNPSPNRKGLTNPQPAFKGILQRYTLELGEPVFVGYPPEIQESKPFEYFSRPRILLRQVLSRKLRLQAVFTAETLLTNQSVQSLLVEPAAKDPPALEFLLGVLNSKLLSWYFVNINSVARRDDFPKIIIQQTRDLPLPGSNPRPNKARHDQIVQLVDQMLALHQRLSAAKTPQEKTSLERQIAAADTQIDRLVYDLYDLTAEEIKIVEGAVA